MIVLRFETLLNISTASGVLAVLAIALSLAASRRPRVAGGALLVGALLSLLSLGSVFFVIFWR